MERDFRACLLAIGKNEDTYYSKDDDLKIADISDDDYVVAKAEYDAQEYARNRLEAYNALNQLELISDDSINGTTTHKDAILAIKAEFPKP